MSNFVLVSEKNRHENLFQSLKTKIGEGWLKIKQRNDFTLELLKSYKPDFVFIPHWSYIIPRDIFENFTCIVFHMTDLPFGRGGSPLQNLISRGYSETKISAIKVDQGVDTGEIYLKENLSLLGTAEEIFIRADKIIEEMILKIIKDNVTPVPQDGEPVIFKRRKPHMSNLEGLHKIEEVFDHIRMLDSEGYPHAFIETDNFRFEFTRASLKTNNSILADVKIYKK